MPSGASIGVHEAVELRDGPSTGSGRARYGGLGVLRAIENVEKKIAPKLAGVEITEQEKIDDLMIKLDGTENKNKLGANAILAVSLSCARAGALASGVELYEYIATNFKCQVSSYPRLALIFLTAASTLTLIWIFRSL